LGNDAAGYQKNGLAIPEHVPGIGNKDGTVITLIDELIGPNYHLDVKDRIQLEKKSDMKARGVTSPNVADALALTYAENVPELHLTQERQRYDSAMYEKNSTYDDFDPFDMEKVTHGFENSSFTH